jgi:hypothetical protein
VWSHGSTAQNNGKDSMNFKIIKGKYIIIHELNKFFGHVSQMMLEHFDRLQYADTVFSIGTYIECSVPELRKQFPNKRIIIYQLEQLMSLDTWQSVEKIVENIKGADEIWDYDFLNTVWLNNNCKIKVDKLQPMLYTHRLDHIINSSNPKIDVLFYGFINERRFKIFQKLQSQLYGKITLVWIYGTFDLDEHISNSKVILNLHSTEPWNRQEQVRMFYPLINGKTNVSETSQHNNMPDEIIECEVDNLASVLLETCSTDKWKIFGQQAKQNFKNRTGQYLSRRP